MSTRKDCNRQEDNDLSSKQSKPRQKPEERQEKKYFCQTRTRYLVQLIKKGKNLTRVWPIMYTLTSNKAIYPSQEKGEMKMK